MNEADRKRGNQLILFGAVFLFVAAYLFSLIGQGLGPYANVTGAWSFAIGILIFALSLIILGSYFRMRL